ncbi:MAG TPA: hemerythrin domain-containing protein [Vicinamibacterales bacterium]|nr:hemerythrin domain-containing protein [Vicinamibacterales bacterium]
MAKRMTRKKSRPKKVTKNRTRRERKPPPKPSKLSTSATFARGMVAGAVATVAGKLPGGEARPDAIEILEREHRRFENLLKQGEETTEQARSTRRDLLKTLTAELNAHELMEEKVLYPALQAHPQAREIVLEGYQEHHVADLIVKELHDVATNDEVWGAKFKVLKESLEHHIKEEEGNMFRLARGIFAREELRMLAARMLKIRAAAG